MKCQNCGASAAAAETRCAHCGAALPDPGPMAVADAEPGVAPAQAAPHAGQPASLPLAGPWPRYWARLFDLGLWLIVTGLVGAVLAGLFAPELLDRFAAGGRLQDQVLTLALVPFAMALDALTYALFGNTPGKWLAGLRVSDEQGRKLRPLRYLRRNLGVYANGIALGLGLIALITLIHNFNKVKSGRLASWDERTEARVFRMRGGLGRTTLAATAYLLLMGSFALLALIPEPTPEQVLQEIADSANEGTPRMTGEQLRLDRIFLAPGRVLQYDYTLLDADEGADLEALKTRTQSGGRSGAVNLLCRDLVDLKDFGARVRFRYADRANRTLVTFEASQKDCSGGS